MLWYIEYPLERPHATPDEPNATSPLKPTASEEEYLIYHRVKRSVGNKVGKCLKATKTRVGGVIHPSCFGVGDLLLWLPMVDQPQCLPPTGRLLGQPEKSGKCYRQ